MNNVFSLHRFLLLFRAHFGKNLKGYSLSCLVLIGATIGLFFLLIGTTRPERVDAGQQLLVYVLAVYGGLFIFSATALQPYQRIREGMFQLTLPASGLEKFLLAWTVSLIGYTLCANVVYFLVRYGVLQFYASKGYEIAGLFDKLSQREDGVSVGFVFGMLYVFIHAFALLGSIVFRKLAVLKTALMLLLVVVAYWALNSLLFRSMFTQEVTQAPLIPLMPVFITDDGASYRVAISGWPYAVFIFASVMIGVLWLAAYHKLREKEA